jgi:hypothetical protein
VPGTKTMTKINAEGMAWGESNRAMLQGCRNVVNVELSILLFLTKAVTWAI